MPHSADHSDQEEDESNPRPRAKSDKDGPVNLQLSWCYVVILILGILALGLTSHLGEDEFLVLVLQGQTRLCGYPLVIDIHEDETVLLIKPHQPQHVVDTTLQDLIPPRYLEDVRGCLGVVSVSEVEGSNGSEEQGEEQGTNHSARERSEITLRYTELPGQPSGGVTLL